MWTLTPLQQENKGLCVFTTLLWSSFFVATIVLHQVIDAWPGMIPKIDTDPRPRLLRGKDMVGIISQLRQGDHRLVRSDRSEEMEIEQHRYCPYKIPSLLLTLCTSTAKSRSLGKMAVSLHKRGIAAEAISLCLSHQPPFRDLAANSSFLQPTSSELTRIQHKQLVAHSLAQGLTVLLQEGIRHYNATQDASSIVALSQAAETVWAASFHHVQHRKELLNAGVIPALGEIIVSLTPPSLLEDPSTKLPWGQPPARAILWAAAALQNLAADYCNNELGFCIWEWNRPYATPQWTLDPETRLVAPELAESARIRIAAIPHLMEILAAWTCQGPIDAVANETYGWPSEAVLWKDSTFNAQSPHLQSPSIVPWAAAGVFKNLILGQDGPDVRRRVQALPQYWVPCLCALTQSPDWLERSKASEALRRYSSAASTLCPSVHDNCRDDEEWKNAESGDDCQEYERERYCVEYGHEVDPRGKTAKEACCACGGGHPKQTEDENVVSVGEGGDDNATVEPKDGMGGSLTETAVPMEMGQTSEEPLAASDSTLHEEL